MTDGDLSECEILLKRDEIIEIQVSTQRQDISNQPMPINSDNKHTQLSFKTETSLRNHN